MSQHLTCAAISRRYLMSFMRSTDDFNANEATHKYNQIRRLLSSSGDNWVRSAVLFTTSCFDWSFGMCVFVLTCAAALLNIGTLQMAS